MPCCQMDWQGSFQAVRVHGLADFGHNMIMDCFPDLGNISCLNPGEFPSTVSGAPSSMLGGLTANQPLYHPQVRHNLKIKFLSSSKGKLRSFLSTSSSLISPHQGPEQSRHWQCHRDLRQPQGQMLWQPRHYEQWFPLHAEGLA